MTLARAEIERLVPHTGAMCLLDAVLGWDATHIVCSGPPVGPDHPLDRDGGLPAVVAGEYAAQAAAVHGGLLDGVDAPRPGMLVKLSGLTLHAAYFTPSASPQVRASLLARQESGCAYAFEVTSAECPLATGQLTIAFGPEAPR